MIDGIAGEVVASLAFLFVYLFAWLSYRRFAMSNSTS
jgi:hypothetical protein